MSIQYWIVFNDKPRLELTVYDRTELYEIIERARVPPRVRARSLVDNTATPWRNWHEGFLDELAETLIPGYDALNAKDAQRAVRALEPGREEELVWLLYHEQATKDRSTVTDAINARLQG